MLKHPTLDLLHQLGLAGMAQAFAALAAIDEAAGLGHAEWLALLLDHEATYRNDRRLALRLRHARLRHHAVPEDVDYRAPRGLDRRRVRRGRCTGSGCTGGGQGSRRRSRDFFSFSRTTQATSGSASARSAAKAGRPASGAPATATLQQ